MKIAEIVALSEAHEDRTTEMRLLAATREAKYGTETVSLTFEDGDMHIIGDVDQLLAVVVVRSGSSAVETLTHKDQERDLPLWAYAEFVWANI